MSATDRKFPHFHGDDIPQSAPADAAFHVIPVPFEASVSYGSGTRNGPDAILHASTQLEAYIDGAVPGDAGIYTAPFVECDSDAATTLDRIEKAVTKTLDLGKTPFLLGGEHTISIAPALALQKRGIDFGIVQFDAHADLRDTYQNNPNSHACVMKRALDLGIPIFQIGVRALSQAEASLRAKEKIPYVDADSIARHGIPESLLPDSFPKKIYISFDVDCLDPSLLPSTGTPEPGGLNWYQAIEGLEKVIQGRTVIGADVVELAPTENHHASEFIAAKLVYKIMDLILKSQ